jgi:hypothetical protein
MAEEFGALYPVTIPSYEDNADIQAAIKLYHYGSLAYNENNLNPAALVSSSVAAHFAAIEQQLSEINPITITPLQNAENLNEKIENGYYSQDSNQDARSQNSVNYPVFPDTNGIAYAGLLTVINAENLIYQTYQMQNVEGRSILYVRSRNDVGIWLPWRRISDSTHTHDERYYLKGEVDSALGAKQNTITGAATTITGANLAANQALISNGNGKVFTSNVTSSELGHLSGATSNIQTNINSRLAVNFSNANADNRPAGRSAVGIFVQQNEPTSGMRAGDLWFW